MNKRIITTFTLITFSIFTFACTIYKTTKERPEIYAGSKDETQVLAVLTLSGEHFEFSKEDPGTLTGDAIHGIPIGAESLQSIAIPLSEVEMIWVRKVDAGLTFLAVLGGVAAVIVVVAAIYALTKESCPFIYAYNGEQYIFDAEPYGGAICQGLKRTEWCSLDYLKPVQGQYKVLLRNEVYETQYTDELRLLVVDHPLGTKVVSDLSGNIHTLSRLVSPNRVFDSQGRDLMLYFSDNDWIFWQSRMREKNPDRMEDLRDEIIFEFPKPMDAKEIKLLFNGCSTLWASQMIKRVLELHGNKVSDWYDEVNSFGPAFYELMNWDVKEQLYRLHIQVVTDKGWKSKGMALGGGPFVSEDRVYTLDVSDVPGDLLRIKLTPPANYWMINYLAVDYSDAQPNEVTELAAVEAVDHNGRDVRDILFDSDNEYLVMPNIGDSTKIVFLAPPEKQNLSRSLIMKVSGYYDIHLQATGEPQLELYNKIIDQPGFAIQYAFKEYLKWQQENVKAGQK